MKFNSVSSRCIQRLTAWIIMNNRIVPYHNWHPASSSLSLHSFNAVLSIPKILLLEQPVFDSRYNSQFDDRTGLLDARIEF